MLGWFRPVTVFAECFVYGFCFGRFIEGVTNLGRILVAWVLTLPAAGILAAVAWLAMTAIGLS